LPTLFETVMARVRNTASLHNGAAEVETEGASVERDVVSEVHGSGGSSKRTESVQASDAGAHSGAGADIDEGSRMCSYYFSPSMVTVSRIKEMIDRGYFTEGMAHMPGEETILEPNADEVVVFEEFFYCWFEGAPTPGPLRYITTVPSTVASANPQHHWAIVKVCLGGG
jgi:hypothetical protein